MGDERTAPPGSRHAGFWLALLLLVAVLSLFFYKAALPGQTLFSNDGPLGRLMSDCRRTPGTLTGGWQDLNSVGYHEGEAGVGPTFALLWLLGPVGFSKFYAPLSLLFLGMAAWCFLRQIGLGRMACILGGLATALNSGYFSTACWGMAAHPIALGMMFLALAALAKTAGGRGWLRAMVAGLAVGLGVADGADLAAIFSIFVALFALYRAWISEGRRGRNLALGFGRVGLVAACAGLVAAHTITVMVATQIHGVAGTQQDARTKEQRWDFATQWSLPKRETLGFVVPGLFGYRMDTPSGGAYWGAIGRDPTWDRYFDTGRQGRPPAGFLRFTGGGYYTGILVALVAVWAVAQSFRKKESAFSSRDRRCIWFWAGVAGVSLLLAFGRFAPFYRLLYALPYSSTIRNPAKFVHVVNWALVILFAYGVHGLWQRYVATAPAAPEQRQGVLSWWKNVRGFDRSWTIVSLLALGAVVVSWLIFASYREALEGYLREVASDPSAARAIAGFSLGQAGWFLLFFAVAIALLTWVLSGAFRADRGAWPPLLLGLFIVLDLGRANQPWIVTWDYPKKYASNAVIDMLRDKPCERRVAGLPPWFTEPGFSRAFNLPSELGRAEANFRQLYSIEWMQHQFPYYNVQSLDVVQMPRVPADIEAFEGAMQPRGTADLATLLARRWELTNTRYLLGSADFVEVLNQVADPTLRRFRIAQSFDIVPKPGIARPSKLEDLTAVPATRGPYALIEFTGALPRLKLYGQWQVAGSEREALERIASPLFEPSKTVIVTSAELPASPAGASPDAGEVRFVSYSPKDIVVSAQAQAPSVLLFNDRFDPNWKVYVDGQPQTLLRCNYLMRGVYLPPGLHRVNFRFRPPTGPLYISLAAVAFLLCIPRLLKMLFV